jgi:hypothetical protein
MSDIEYLEMIDWHFKRLKDRIEFMPYNIFINELPEIKRDLNRKSNDLELYCRALINKLQNE